MPSLYALWDCFCKLKNKVESLVIPPDLTGKLSALQSKVEAQPIIVYQYSQGTPGWNFMLWDDTAGPHLDPLEWSAPSTDPTGFPDPSTTAPAQTGIFASNNITDNGAGGGLAARYMKAWTYYQAPADGFIRDNNTNTGELGMALIGDCCGGPLVEAPGGNHTTSTSGQDRTLMDPYPVEEGKWYCIYNPQSDSGAFQGFDLEFSSDGTTYANVTGHQAELPEVEYQEIGFCDAIPSGWQLKPLTECCAPKYITSGGGDENTDEQLLSTTLDPTTGATDSITISNGNTIPIVHPPECEPIKDTRNAIRALRNSSSLDPNCKYIITDYSRGCLGDAEICLKASDVNQFAHDVDVNTTFDNTSWRGTYDIDTNRILSLEDNWNNKVYSLDGIQVDEFPWGNTRFRENTVEEDARLLVECDSAMAVYNNTFSSGSSTNLTGTTGNLYRSNIDSQALLQIPGAAVNIQGLDMDSRARILGDNATTVSILYHKQSSEGYWDFRNQDNIRSYYSNIHSTAKVYYTSGTQHWLYYLDIGSYGHLRQESGIVQAYYSAISAYGELRNEANSGQFQLYASNLDSRAYVRNLNTNRVYYYATDISSSGRPIHSDAEYQRLQYSTVKDLAQVNMNGTATVLYSSNIDSQSILNISGGNHYRMKLSAYARLSTAFNTRSVYGFGSWAQTLTAANTNKGRDYFNNNLV